MIAYTPVDLPFQVPDYSALVSYVESNYLINLEDTFGYTSLLCPLVARHPVTNWRDATDVFSDNNEGFNIIDKYQLYFPPNVRELFPSLFELLNLLPYDQIVGAALNMHLKDLPAHQDEIDTNEIYGPDRYNVLLSPHYGQQSFFVSKDKINKDYPVILKDYPVYAFDNKNIYHGADIVLDKRIIMVCAGVINNSKHQEIIDRSVEKFKDYVIQY